VEDCVGQADRTTLFLVMVLMATLPILGVCFLMGGVSFEEFTIVALLQIVTALCGAMIGLFCSSLSRRASSAMGWTIALMLFWLVVSWIAFSVWENTLTAPGTLSRINQTRYFLVGLFGQTNPIIVVLATIDPQIFSSAMGGIPLSSAGLPTWAVCILIQLLACAIFFWLATRAVRKPLSEPWSEPSKTPKEKAFETKLPKRKHPKQQNRFRRLHLCPPSSTRKPMRGGFSARFATSFFKRGFTTRTMRPPSPSQNAAVEHGDLGHCSDCSGLLLRALAVENFH
jgi:hypothetical protein